MELCIQLPNLSEIFEMKLCQELLSLINLKNFNDAYNILIKHNIEKLYCNELILSIAFFVYQQLGQYYRIATLFNSDLLNSLSNMEFRLKILQQKIEAEFILAENLSEFEAVQNDIISNFKCFAFINDSKFIALEASNRLKIIFLQCQIQTKKINCQAALDVSLNTLFPTTEVNNELRTFLLHFFNSYFYYHLAEVKNLEISRDEIREAMQFESVLTEFSNICNITVLNAQILIERDQRQLAISQLVNAAQKNAYSSKIFCLLAENLFTTLLFEKAKLCAERARLLNPQSERTAKLLYEIYTKQVFLFCNFVWFFVIFISKNFILYF